MRKTLKVLQDRKATTVAAMQAMLAVAAADNRPLTADEDTAYVAHEATLTAVERDLKREMALQEAERTMTAAAADPDITVGETREGRAPFASLGEQLQCIAKAGLSGNQDVDPRLLATASGGSASVGSDGGFLIRKEYSTELFRQGLEVGVLASRCSVQPIGAGNDGLEVVYVDETSRATGSRWGGVQVYRAAEAATVTASQPKLGKWESRLEDIIGLAYMTERLLQDAGAMQGVYTDAFGEEFSFKVDDEIWRGTGAGQCLGLMNHIYDSTTTLGSVVKIAKESGQANDTIVAENIINMWAKVTPRAKARGAWFINSECSPQLTTMQIGTGASGQLVYLPPGGLTGSAFGSIYGRPVIEIEHASALGDLGDIAFLDLSQYQLITKGGVQQDDSMHVRFLYNERAFRWVARINGAPRLKAALTPYKGASGSKISPFVTLAAR